jgi:hypothetical protein
MQCCSLALWRQCLNASKPGGNFQIHCELIFLNGWQRWMQSRRDDMAIRSMADLPDFGEDARPPEPVAHEPAIKVDGCRFTLADAHLDDAGEAETLERGIGAGELARRLGCTKQNVMDRPERFGGVSVPCGKYRRWRFPATAGMDTR